MPELIPFYDTDKFLADLDTGELFVLVRSEWRCAGLYCMNNPFNLEKLWESIEHNSAIMECDLEQEQQTTVVRMRQTVQQSMEPRRAHVPSLPLMGDPEVYVKYPDAMPPLTQRNYV